MHLVHVRYFFLQNATSFILVNVFIWLPIREKVVATKITNSITFVALFVAISLSYHFLVILESDDNIDNHLSRLFANIFGLF